MKIVLLSDLHATLRLPHARVTADATRSDRLDDVCSIFDHVVEVATKEQAKGVFVLGDLFHTRHPDAPTLRAISGCLRHWMDRGLDVNLLPGNHDAHSKRGLVYSLSFLSELDIDGLTILTADEVIHTGDVEIHSFPWKPEPVIRRQLEALRAPTKQRVGLFHAEVAGATDQGRPMTRGLDQSRLFDLFDVVLSGHVHYPQEFENCHGAYLGSPMELRFSEDDGADRGVWTLDLEDFALEKHPITTTPKFVRWNLASSPGYDLAELAHDLLDELAAELAGHRNTRDVYLETVLTGTRAEAERVAPMVAEAVESTDIASHPIRKQKNKVVFTDAGGERVRELTAGRVATAEELASAYVSAFADPAEQPALTKLGRELLR